MKITVAIITIVILLGGCATEGKFVTANRDNACDGKGKSTAFIRYGDSYIEVTPKTTSKRKGEIIFMLKPDPKSAFGIDYSELEITIMGKKNKDNWLDISGKSSGGKKIFVCVDKNQPLGEYNYLVRVPGVGTIDPRINVIN
jgi:hypothetical protein